MTVAPACPTGNGETRGPESAGGMGTPLPGTRPSRAAANEARNSADLRFQGDPVAVQDGMGTEDMEGDVNYLGTESEWPECDPPDLAAMGNGGEPFGGV
jgi:hypothetical protein